MTFLTVFITDSMCLSDSFFLDDIMGSFFVFRVFFMFVSKQGKTQKMTETKHKRKKETDEYTEKIDSVRHQSNEQLFVSFVRYDLVLAIIKLARV